jgi:hypothetical protein
VLHTEKLAKPNTKNNVRCQATPCTDNACPHGSRGERVVDYWLEAQANRKNSKQPSTSTDCLLADILLIHAAKQELRPGDAVLARRMPTGTRHLS